MRWPPALPQVVNIDSSADALDTGKTNIELNHLPLENTEWITGDVFQELRKLRDRAESLRPDYPGSAQVCRHRQPGGEGSPGIQGYQPAGFQAVKTGRDPVHLFLLRWNLP